MEKAIASPIMGRVYVCEDCIADTLKFLLTNQKLLQEMKLPTTLQTFPVDEKVAEPCEKCNLKKASCYVPCVK